MDLLKNIILLFFFAHYYLFLIGCALYDILKFLAAKIVGRSCERIWIHPH